VAEAEDLVAVEVGAAGGGGMEVEVTLEVEAGVGMGLQGRRLGGGYSSKSRRLCLDSECI